MGKRLLTWYPLPLPVNRSAKAIRRIITPQSDERGIEANTNLHNQNTVHRSHLDLNRQLSYGSNGQIEPVEIKIRNRDGNGIFLPEDHEPLERPEFTE